MFSFPRNDLVVSHFFLLHAGVIMMRELGCENNNSCAGTRSKDFYLFIELEILIA